MSSSHVGCQAEVRAKPELAFYQHCFSHCLNLAISHSCQIAELRLSSVFITHQSGKVFFSVFRPLNIQNKKKKKVRGFSKTRWVEHCECYESYYEMYSCIALTFEAILNPAAYESVYVTVLNDGETTMNDWIWDRDTHVKPQGLLRTMQTPCHAISLTTVMFALEPIKPPTIKLQKRNQDIYQAYKLVDETIDFIKSRRADINDTFDH